MSLFDIFKSAYWRTPKIPREIFVADLDEEENFEPIKNNNNMDNSKSNTVHYQYQGIVCRKALDDFLNRDFDAEGYNDALIDSDISNMKSHTENLKLQLEKIVRDCLALLKIENSYYKVDIEIQSNFGNTDKKAILEVGKENILEEISRIETMFAEAQQDKGIGCLPILSYEQGFKRGIIGKSFI